MTVGDRRGKRRYSTTFLERTIKTPPPPTVSHTILELLKRQQKPGNFWETGFST